MTGLRGRLRAATPTAAAFLDIGSPISAEVTAASGFDVVVVDLEHGAGDEGAARDQIRAADRHADVIVRAPDGPGQVARMLDAGAVGILFPQVADAAEAAAAAMSVRYAGRRGVSGLSRSAGYGRHGDDWRVEADGSVACIVQVERASALNHLDAIAALDDVDGLLVGPADLSNDMGCAPDLSAEPLRGATLAVAAAARAHGKAAGLHVAGDEDAGGWAAAGFNLLSCSFETGLLATASEAAAARLASAFGGR
jgi:2-dehydro-3-deoxyglucarate aldolase/4-hydroxy-2-oxoheptanedioate aldolase